MIESDRTDDPSAAPLRQPLLHDSLVTLTAPMQVWSTQTGEVGGAPIHGYWAGDQRFVSALSVRVGGVVPEPIGLVDAHASRTRFAALLRGLDGVGADPDLRVERERRTDVDSITETFEVRTRAKGSRRTTAEVVVVPDAIELQAVKSGAPGVRVDATGTAEGATWTAGSTTVALDAPKATVAIAEGRITLTWELELSPSSPAVFDLTLRTETADGAVAGVRTPCPWSLPEVADFRLAAWLSQASTDLDALRMRLPDREDEFFAAGAPWFFTLFGRDSIWAARFLLRVDAGMAASTLRTLASLQGTRTDPETAEQPGKIMHELRSASLTIDSGELSLPPLYYGTIDATPLWICLLHDAWRAGMPEAEVRALLPALEAALAWMRDHGDSDGDGFLEYLDESGHGLANQGWKDSNDSVQWSDGTLADGPIALSEVQAYAYEAAVHGADLLDAFGRPGGEDWRRWARRLADDFRARFWVTDDHGRYPAIALDAAKRPVDTLTSNIGHLVGTGLLSAEEERLVADRLVSPELSSGFGLRTLSTRAGGYWPLSYHGGSVWAHDTAVAISGLHRAGFADEAAELAEGLLRAAAAFDFRMPELHAGDPADGATAPAPYPAACRPQAWSAAAAFVVWDALRSGETSPVEATA
ncbi:hypothetical protein FHX74_002370 [Friedmanniella endophytica]|uniref:Amylo-alpha-1,6-glucosidase n=1 Tax=Microlunatus kandeliicorticis TaxID=1759536 RepID=A0A7W3IT50_9ACTN|nr:glycogen debranching N-terminal domain-containing protein [Microlunatus kandeliicorticis]MBA8794751.1 hypothetical protein [Microlunatus kandeliicorticis]